MNKKASVYYLILFFFGILNLSAWAEGWPNQAGDQVFSSPAIADLDNDGKAEIIITSVSHGVYVWQRDGSLASGWPKATTHAFRTSAVVGNLDADNQLEVVVCTADTIDGDVSGNYVYAYHHDGSLMAGFPKTIPNTRILSTPVIGNLSSSDTPDYPEIVVLAGNRHLYAWHSDGTVVSGFETNIGGVEDQFGNLVITSSPAMADTDADNLLEVFVGSTGGLLFYINNIGSSSSQSTDSWILASPSIADIDDDGSYEVVVGSGDRKVHVWRIGSSSLSAVSGWPQKAGGLVYSSAALADVDGNDSGKLEIVCGSYDNKVYVWNHDGTLVPGWPQETRGYVLGSPVVMDIDGDNMAEIIVGSAGRKVYIWNHDGTLLENWPHTLTTDIYSSPAVADLDGDGRLSIVIADFNGIVYEWELSYDTSGSSFTQDWRMFGRDATRGSWVE